MTGFRFQNLSLLLLIPLVITIVWWTRRRGLTNAVVYSSVLLFNNVPVTLASHIKAALPWLNCLGLCLMVVALARPQSGREEFRAPADGIAIEMCIDKSGSMQAMDFELDGEPANRLEVVKAVFRDFVSGKGDLPGRPDDLIGLIAFGGFADSLCPVTLDHDVLLKILAGVQLPKPIRDANGRVLNERLLQEEMATAIGDALVLAVDRLKQVESKSRVIILLSDGESNAGITEPEKAAELAKSYGIKVYTIGVGSTGLAPVAQQDRFGRTQYVQQRVRLDEATLKMIAQETDGQYFNARNTDALKQVYERIDALEKTTTEGVVYTEYKELYHFALVPGLALILLVALLSTTRFRSLP